MKRGVWYAVGAYVIWGLLPIYWKLLHRVPATQLISHRLIWSAVLLAGIIAISGQLRTFLREVSSRRVLIVYGFAGLLLTVNWLTYVWAVNAGFVVQTSLGYFINPLISILLGVVFLSERLRPWQWTAIALAAAGVTYMTVASHELPWIALTLAITFAVYGLLKKKAPLGSVNGLALETGLMFLPALAFALVAERSGSGAFVHDGTFVTVMLVGAGLVTTVPLLMFASATRRIPLSLIGVLQYIAPTIQFLLGVLVYHEVVGIHRLIGFALVWTALAIFGVEGAIKHRSTAFPATAE